MSSITLNKNDVEKAASGYEGDGLKLVEEGEWTHCSPKYETQTTIFEFEGKHYEWSQTRSGSPFTDWYYTDEDDTESTLYEVEMVEIITMTWKLVS